MRLPPSRGQKLPESRTEDNEYEYYQEAEAK